MFNIVFLEPEMGSNTGNIGRSCVLTGSRLHLIEPLGFEITDKQVRRAGLDYWKDVDLVVHKSYANFLKYLPQEVRIFYCTTKAKKFYHQVHFKDGDYIMFGKESKGIPESILFEHPERCIKIPMITEMKRSLNLANSANIVLYEALRQNNFFDLR